MKQWKKLLVTLALVSGIGLGATLPAAPVGAINVFDQCKANASSAVCKAKNDDAANMIQTVINILLFVLGMIAVIMIVVGGIRYTTSNGNSTQVKEAKDTVLYAVVGLIVAILSYTIVNFVLGWF